MCKSSIVFSARKIPPGILKLIRRKLTETSSDIASSVGPLVDNNVLIVNTGRDLLVLEVHEFVIEVQFQASSDASSSTTESVCRCKNLFDIFERILREENLEVYSVRNCNGKGLICEQGGERPIEIDLVNQTDALVKELCSIKQSCTRIITEADIPEEKENTASATGGAIFFPNQSWMEQVNEKRAEYQDCIRRFGLLEDKLGRHRSLRDNESERSDASANVVSSSGDVAVSAASSDRSVELRPANVMNVNSDNYTLVNVLRVFADRMLPGNWDQMRSIMASHVPASVLSGWPNGLALFNELVNQNLIGQGNLSFLRDLFFDIGRVDLVHLTDCIAEGDLTLLEEEQRSERGRLYAVPFVNEGLTSSMPVQEMQGLSIQPTHRASEASESDASGNRTPTGSPVTASTGDVGLGDGNDNETADTVSGSSESNVGVSSEVSSTRTENLTYPCEHYDRYCEVQFTCSERFWACHRCHNASCTCGRNKLRSRDIQKIKCIRCGKVQQFPKERPNCEQCDLTLSEYFCPHCQHLTGTQNHPYHCNKCGICRVHGDRSFHCDVCGVCLDINLRGNHLCRAGSAHDECCICFEDAFTGCQILPCSHKVHKECATMMLRNGITRCPICRESFAHRIERRPVNQ